MEGCGQRLEFRCTACTFYVNPKDTDNGQPKGKPEQAQLDVPTPAKARSNQCGVEHDSRAHNRIGDHQPWYNDPGSLDEIAGTSAWPSVRPPQPNAVCVGDGSDGWPGTWPGFGMNMPALPDLSSNVQNVAPEAPMLPSNVPHLPELPRDHKPFPPDNGSGVVASSSRHPHIGNLTSNTATEEPEHTDKTGDYNDTQDGYDLFNDFTDNFMADGSPFFDDLGFFSENENLDAFDEFDDFDKSNDVNEHEQDHRADEITSAIAGKPKESVHPATPRATQDPATDAENDASHPPNNTFDIPLRAAPKDPPNSPPSDPRKRKACSSSLAVDDHYRNNYVALWGEGTDISASNRGKDFDCRPLSKRPHRCAPARSNTATPCTPAHAPMSRGSTPSTLDFEDVDRNQVLELAVPNLDLLPVERSERPLVP